MNLEHLWLAASQQAPATRLKSVSKLDKDLGALGEIESVVLSKDMGLQASMRTQVPQCIFLWESQIHSTFPRERIHCASEDDPRRRMGGRGRSKEKEGDQSCLLSQ